MDKVSAIRAQYKEEYKKYCKQERDLGRGPRTWEAFVEFLDQRNSSDDTSFKLGVLTRSGFPNMPQLKPGEKVPFKYERNVTDNYWYIRLAKMTNKQWNTLSRFNNKLLAERDAKDEEAEKKLQEKATKEGRVAATPSAKEKLKRAGADVIPSTLLKALSKKTALASSGWLVVVSQLYNGTITMKKAPEKLKEECLAALLLFKLKALYKCESLKEMQTRFGSKFNRKWVKEMVDACTSGEKKTILGTKTPVEIPDKVIDAMERLERIVLAAKKSKLVKTKDGKSGEGEQSVGEYSHEITFYNLDGLSQWYPKEFLKVDSLGKMKTYRKNIKVIADLVHVKPKEGEAEKKKSTYEPYGKVLKFQTLMRGWWIFYDKDLSDVRGESCLQALKIVEADPRCKFREGVKDGKLRIKVFTMNPPWKFFRPEDEPWDVAKFTQEDMKLTLTNFSKMTCYDKFVVCILVPDDMVQSMTEALRQVGGYFHAKNFIWVQKGGNLKRQKGGPPVVDRVNLISQKLVLANQKLLRRFICVFFFSTE